MPKKTTKDTAPLVVYVYNQDNEIETTSTSAKVFDQQAKLVMQSLTDLKFSGEYLGAQKPP